VQEIRLSPEHAACQWVTAHEAEGLFPVGHWLRELIGRAEVMRRLLPEELRSSIGPTALRYSGFVWPEVGSPTLMSVPSRPDAKASLTQKARGGFTALVAI
jgi:hypothetical protein